MSLVTWAKTNSRAIGKVGLYVAGGLALGYPLVKAGMNVYQGKPVDRIPTDIVWEGVGYNMDINSWDKAQFRNILMRDGAGALAIWAARKL